MGKIEPSAKDPQSAVSAPRRISEKEAGDIRYKAYAGSYGKRRPPETREQYLKGLGISGDHVIAPVPLSELNNDIDYGNNPVGKEHQYAKLTTDAPPIHVSLTPNGKLYVRDGAHRVAAAKIRGENNIKAMMTAPEYERYSSLRQRPTVSIPDAMRKVERSPGDVDRGSYIAIENLRKAGVSDADILKAADDGKVIISRYDGPRHGVDLSKYLYDGHNYYIGVAVPRK